MKIKEALNDGTLSLEDDIDYADMTEEEYKQEIERLNKERNKTYENGLNYFLELQEKNEEIERLNNIIEEIREYIEVNKQYAELEDYGKNGEYYIDEIGLLEILDKENK